MILILFHTKRNHLLAYWNFLHPLSLLGYNIFIIEPLYRLNFNDGLLTFYSFFWTTSTYLNIFTISGLLFLMSFFQSFPSLIFFYSTYLIEIQNSNYTNYRLFNLNFNIYGFNSFLINDLNKYHPGVLYFSAWIITCLFIINHTKLYIEKSYYFFNELFFYRAPVINLFLTGVSFLALFLGSWWAMQENTWGGWWNWDPSENLGLMLLLLIIFFNHSRFKLFLIFVLIFLFFMCFCYSLIAYFLFQLNFDLTAHNFGIKFYFFFNNNFFLAESFLFGLIGIISCTLIFLRLNFFLFLYTFSIFHFLVPKTLIKFYFKFLLFATIVCLIFPSTYTLFNHLVWNFLLFHTLNFYTETEIFTVVWALLILMLFLRMNFKGLYLTPISIALCNYLYLQIGMLLILVKIFFYLHLIVIHFFINSLINLKTSIVFWDYKAFFASYTHIYASLTTFSKTYNSHFLEHLWCFFYNEWFWNQTINCLLNYFWNFSFNLFTSIFYFCNFTVNGGSCFFIFNYFETLNVSNLFSLTLIYFLILIFLYFQKKIIV